MSLHSHNVDEVVIGDIVNTSIGTSRTSIHLEILDTTEYTSTF